MIAQKGVELGIAWYRPEQWTSLRALATDPEELDQTHAEWLAVVTRSIADLRRTKVVVKKIDVDVHVLARWCQDRGQPLNGSSRAMFVTEKMEAASGD